MSILDEVDELPAASARPHSDDDDEQHGSGNLLDAALAQDARPALRGRRRKIGQPLQLALLRRYVQCAKQLGTLPNRATTQQLLDDGYAEFLLRGGDISEPRLSYAAFLKLVRNRRNEAQRQPRVLALGRGGRRNQSERLEIRALIDELEHVRRRHRRSSLDDEQVDESGGEVGRGGFTSRESVVSTASLDSLEAGAAGSIPSPSSPSSSAAVAASHSASSPRMQVHGPDEAFAAGESVLVAREQLDAMLRFAQETLAKQKQLLDEVRAIEQRLDSRQHHHDL